MNKRFFEGGAYQLLTTFSQLIVVSMLWFFTSIPLITVGASTAALYHIITMVIRKDSTQPVKKYFKAFRENFVQTLGPSILLVLYGVVMAMELSNAILGKSDYYLPPFAWFAICFLLLTLCITIFSLIARFQSSLLAIVWLAVALLAKNLTLFFGLLGMLVASAIVIYLAPGLAIFLPGLVLYGLSFLLEPVFLAYMEQRGIGTSE